MSEAMTGYLLMSLISLALLWVVIYTSILAAGRKLQSSERDGRKAERAVPGPAR